VHAGRHASVWRQHHGRRHGCNQRPDATASASAVTIGFAAPEPERSAYKPPIAAFNAQNSDVRIEFVPR